MSQHLPARPNIDHLRKHARTLLGDLKRRNPQAKLADALHAVAREYGFASWPKLKAHVESVRAEAASGPPMSPFAGRWIADVSRSIRHPANQFQRAVIDFAITGDTVLVTHGFVDESGRRQHGENTIEVDGCAHMADNGYALTATWRDSHLFETVAIKDGEVVGRGKYEISADGRTLTISAPEQVIVLDRK